MSDVTVFSRAVSAFLHCTALAWRDISLLMESALPVVCEPKGDMRGKATIRDKGAIFGFIRENRSFYPKGLHKPIWRTQTKNQ
ncbi:hypothetical protein [Polaromonas sp.]|uniref:hypothetical protein n=1 Tax=Polaromonas sp. TaxID=1869339 RepID=UPI0024892283|nr:hypothetical protein [Polaromonas sp.]MDI1273069.1 hypothetical protein [Polaromonas sp.]